MPMHVGGLQLFKKPEGAGRNYVREMYDEMRQVEEIAPLYLKRPHRSIRTAGQWVWEDDEQFDIEHHVRHSALPKPGRIRELLEPDLAAAQHPPRPGAAAVGVPHHRGAARRPRGDVPQDPPRPRRRRLRDAVARQRAEHGPRRAGHAGHVGQAAEAGEAVEDARTRWSSTCPTCRSRRCDRRSASPPRRPACPAALVKTLSKGLRNETSSLSLYAPRTILNQNITGSRRIAAQDWPIDRLRAIGKATGATLNDVVLAMCSGAMRTYLLELDALPDTSLVAMVPVGLKAKQSQIASAEGGNAVGAVMVQLATDLLDPADRLARVHRSMVDGKRALSSMTPVQIMAMSALGQTPAILGPILRMQGIVRPPYNLIISNVPGPRTTHYWNGAQLLGTYPLSIPINGMALNITCTSYDGKMAFGLTGCRRTVPHLQRLLTHLDDEVKALENAVGV